MTTSDLDHFVLVLFFTIIIASFLFCPYHHQIDFPARHQQGWAAT